jgi:hypothetical protein
VKGVFGFQPINAMPRMWHFEVRKPSRVSRQAKASEIEKLNFGHETGFPLPRSN